MRPILFALPALLVACASPQQACINDATRDLRVINALVAETRGNLNRGFGIEERQDVRTVRTFCTGENEDGSKFRFRCEETETFTRRVPVAIDLNAEAAKLASLESRQALLQANVDGAVAQCQRQFPE